MVAGSSVTAHMAAHLAIMNVAAPIVAIAWSMHRRGGAVSVRQAPSATAVQLSLLWGWHAPPVLAWASANPLALGAMHVSLALAALWFWTSIVSAARRSPAWPLACLLVTAKLFCLFAVLLVLSPRPLYHGHGAGPHSAAPLMADQQLAGLIMLVACPVFYLLAATLIVARWLGRIERRPFALRA
jgi:putative membrane protein